ncbi:MAG: carbamoyltransferase, partial [Acidobacteriia bacterium]|nr:carbamoyltransferase [Terriglobia bacterium]
MTSILGINAYHGDSSACLVIDGKLTCAAEEERFRRIKHWAGFPSQAITYCLGAAGLALGDVDHIAINSDPKANLLQKIFFAAARRPSLRLLMERLGERRVRSSLGDELRTCFPASRFRGEMHKIEHHLAHLGSAFLVSPFDEAVAVSVDGFGDFASTAWGVGRGSKMEIERKVLFPHSLGIFYMSMTQYLGFPHWGDEYKVMGLAPYGKPEHLEKMRGIVRLKEDGTFELDLRFFRHHFEKVQEWTGSAPHVKPIFTPALEELLGPCRQEKEVLTQRHKNIARSVQAMYEEAFFHLLNRLHAKYKLDALAIAGGCGMNSVANGRIYRNTPFKSMYVQSAAGDAGGAIGAAYVVWSRLKADGPRFMMDHAYWGPEFSSEQIESFVDNHRHELDAEGCLVERVFDEGELCSRTAQAIADGNVIGWFQGRMEWGPRALGNRSIVCDPRRADMKDILNRKIKRRESFRPFAPSVLREAVSEWFEQDDDVPFMMQVYQIREDKRPLIPAVT